MHVKYCITSFFFYFSLDLQDSLTELGVGTKSDIESWLTGEKLGSSGYLLLLGLMEISIIQKSAFYQLPLNIFFLLSY